jgi:hypothetical protein
MYAVVPCLYEADRLFSWSLGWDTKLEGWDAKKVYIYICIHWEVLEFDNKEDSIPHSPCSHPSHQLPSR